MATDVKNILDSFPDYLANIGIEVHVQLTTESKIYCSCANKASMSPNTNICQVCTGQPGVLPTLNKKVVDYAILAGLATNCSIAERSSFARKHYFYPDTPKNFQITQGDDPICFEGYVPIILEDGSIKKIRLVRIHMEEDAGKSIHMGSTNETFVDFNRAGAPLLEIVSYPDIANAYEAREYLRMIRLIVQYLGICSGNMEEGVFRADTNISVRKKETEELGTRCELKNINSFKFIVDAINYEIERQINQLGRGERIVQETRLWDTKEHKSIPMRSKEEASDYRYFQEPDLPYVDVDESWIAKIREQMPELPYQKFARLCKEKGLSPYEANIIVEDVALAQYTEEAIQHSDSKNLIKWILRNLLAYLKEQKISPSACKVTPRKLAAIVDMLDKGIINNLAAQEVFEMVAATGKDPLVVVKEKGLEQIGSVDELQKIVQEIMTANPTEVVAYKAGKTKLIGFFVGQAMQKTKGKGDPKVLQELFKKDLA